MLVAWWRFGGDAWSSSAASRSSWAFCWLPRSTALILPFKGELNLFDTFVLVALFGVYTWATSRAPAEDPHLVGPALLIGSTSTTTRRVLTGLLFAFAAYVIFISAHPFAVGLVETGRAYGIDEFLLVQWLAPLASEAPEFIVALLFVWRGQAAAGMRTLVSSKVNQWTLLIGTLPVVFSFGAGHLTGMPLNERQQHELWLTAAQSLFAVVLISEFAMERWEALALLVPFVAQLLLPPMIGPIDVRMAFTFLYLLLAVVLMLDPNRRRAVRHWPGDIRESISGAPSAAATAPEAAPEAASTPH